MNQFVQILLILCVVITLYYIVNQDLLVKNEGMVSMGDEKITIKENRNDKINVNIENTEYPRASDVVKGQFISPQIQDITRVPMTNDKHQTYQKKVIHELNKNNTNVLAPPQISTNFSPVADMNQETVDYNLKDQVNLDCFPKDQLNAQDLLPREDGYNTWQEVNPQAQGHLSNRNFLEAGHNYGINTVGQSLRNANLQLRSDPIIPQIPVGPWQNSTIDPDTNRKQFEIGGDC